MSWAFGKFKSCIVKFIILWRVAEPGNCGCLEVVVMMMMIAVQWGLRSSANN